MNFCTSCGSPVQEADRFCGRCGAPLSTDVAGATASQPSTPAAVTEAWAPTDTTALTPAVETTAPAAVDGPSVSPASSPAGAPTMPAAAAANHGDLTPPTTDLGAVIRANPGPAIRAGSALVLVLIALIKPWEFTSAGLWGELEGEAGAGNGWALVTLLLVAAAAGVGLLADNVKSLGLPVTPRMLQAGLVAPFGILALITMVRMLTEDALMGPSVAIGLVAAVLALQVGGDPSEAPMWRTAAMALLGVGAVLTLWQFRAIGDLASTDGVLALALFLSVGWIPFLAVWFLMGLRDKKPAEWAALIVFGGALLAAVILLSSAADPGLTLMAAGATAAVAPGMAELIRMSSDPAARWLQWVGGIMVLSMVGGAVVGAIALLGAIKAAEWGANAGPLVLLCLVGFGCAVVAGLARNKLFEEPEKGRKISVGFAAASILLYLIALVVSDADLSDPTALMSGFVVPVAVILMLTLPKSVNDRYGNILPSSSSGGVVD